MKNRWYHCPLRVRQRYDGTFQAPEIVSLIFPITFLLFSSHVTLEESPSGNVKNVNYTMICIVCIVIQYSLSNKKHDIIPLGGVKKLHFIQTYEGKFFPFVARGSWLFSKDVLHLIGRRFISTFLIIMTMKLFSGSYVWLYKWETEWLRNKILRL